MSTYLPGLYNFSLSPLRYDHYKEKIKEVLYGERNLISAFDWQKTIQGFSWWANQSNFQKNHGRVSPEARKILETAIGRTRKPVESDPEYQDLFI